MYHSDKDRKPGLAGCFDKFLKSDFRKACSTEHVTKGQWQFYSPDMQLVSARHRSVRASAL